MPPRGCIRRPITASQRSDLGLTKRNLSIGRSHQEFEPAVSVLVAELWAARRERTFRSALVSALGSAAFRRGSL